MTIWQLTLFTCLTISNPLNGSYNKECSWKATGQYYNDKNKCDEIGLAYKGTEELGFSLPLRMIETHSCVKIPVDN